MRPLSILRDTRGVTLVFVALFLVTLLMFLGLCIDTGWMVYVRSQGQARVDAAALAAVSALKPQNTASDNGINAQAQANNFASSTVNMVVNTSTNPSNLLIPMHYDQATGTLTPTTATSWEFDNPPTTTNRDGCNAVQVTNVIDTPLFFSGVRNLAGASENGSTNINVTATAYLSCPGSLIVGENIDLALRSPDYPAQCDDVRPLFQVPAPPEGNALTFIDTIAPGTTLTVGDPVTPLGSGDLTALRNRYQHCNEALCEQDPADLSCTVLLPVIGGANTIEGFAKICITGVGPENDPPEDDPPVRGALECGELGTNTGSGGQCFGTYAQSHILVR